MVDIIHVKPGCESLQLVAKGKPPLYIDGKLLYVFLTFASRIANNASGETVPLSELNEAVGEKEPKRATVALRNAIDDLRKKLATLGRPPDGHYFILTTRRDTA